MKSIFTLTHKLASNKSLYQIPLRNFARSKPSKPHGAPISQNELADLVHCHIKDIK